MHLPTVSSSFNLKEHPSALDATIPPLPQPVNPEKSLEVTNGTTSSFLKQLTNLPPVTKDHVFPLILLLIVWSIVLLGVCFCIRDRCAGDNLSEAERQKERRTWSRNFLKNRNDEKQKNKQTKTHQYPNLLTRLSQRFWNLLPWNLQSVWSVYPRATYSTSLDIFTLNSGDIFATPGSSELGHCTSEDSEGRRIRNRYSDVYLRHDNRGVNVEMDGEGSVDSSDNVLPTINGLLPLDPADRMRVLVAMQPNAAKVVDRAMGKRTDFDKSLPNARERAKCMGEGGVAVEISSISSSTTDSEPTIESSTDDTATTLQTTTDSSGGAMSLERTLSPPNQRERVFSGSFKSNSWRKYPRIVQHPIAAVLEQRGNQKRTRNRIPRETMKETAKRIFSGGQTNLRDIKTVFGGATNGNDNELGNMDQGQIECEDGISIAQKISAPIVIPGNVCFTSVNDIPRIEANEAGHRDNASGDTTDCSQTPKKPVFYKLASMIWPFKRNGGIKAPDKDKAVISDATYQTETETISDAGAMPLAQIQIPRFSFANANPVLKRIPIISGSAALAVSTPPREFIPIRTSSRNNSNFPSCHDLHYSSEQSLTSETAAASPLPLPCRSPIPLSARTVGGALGTKVMGSFLGPTTKIERTKSATVGAASGRSLSPVNSSGRRTELLGSGEELRRRRRRNINLEGETRDLRSSHSGMKSKFRELELEGEGKEKRREGILKREPYTGFFNSGNGR